MRFSNSVDTRPAEVADSLAGFDVSSLWQHNFPTPELVSSAAALLTPLRAWDGREGARSRLIIGPGCVTVSKHDPARAERTADRAREAAWKGAELRATDRLLELRLSDADEELEVVAELAAAGLVGEDQAVKAAEWADHLSDRIRRRDELAAEDAAGPSRAAVVSWSRKSRARMVRALAELDYAPLFEGGQLPAMLTLTYPGDWRTVAPDAKACKRHVDALAKRFRRAYGRPLVAVWKREFQRRGAPHYHLLMTPPAELVHVGGERLSFGQWVSRTWAEVVGHPDPDERRRHVLAGTGIDYAEGMRARDPKRLAVYFSKHGAYAAKEYQNEAPASWVAAGSVGRFWGVWGLERAAVQVEVTPVEAAAAARTLRRWQNANGYRVQREVWRTSSKRVNRETGELVPFRRRSGTWSGSRMRGQLGFAVVNDGAAFASQLATYLDQVRDQAQRAELARYGVEDVEPRRAGVRSTFAAWSRGR